MLAIVIRNIYSNFLSRHAFEYFIITVIQWMKVADFVFLIGSVNTQANLKIDSLFITIGR